MKRILRWLKGGYEYGEVTIHPYNGNPPYQSDVRREVRTGRIEAFVEPVGWYKINESYWPSFKTYEELGAVRCESCDKWTADGRTDSEGIDLCEECFEELEKEDRP